MYKKSRLQKQVIDEQNKDDRLEMEQYDEENKCRTYLRTK